MEVYSNLDVGAMIDWVDPNTAEIQQVDGIQHALITHCAKQRYFITEQTTLVDSCLPLIFGEWEYSPDATADGRCVGPAARCDRENPFWRARRIKGSARILIKLSCPRSSTDRASAF